MNEDGGGRGAWIGLGLAGLVAVVFLVLWLLRGGDMDRLRADLRKAEMSASSLTQRLESEAQTAKSEAMTAVRRAEELEKKIRDDARRAGEETTLLERRFRAEIDASAQRLSEANAQLEKVRNEARAAAEQAAVALREATDAAKNAVSAEGGAALREALAREEDLRRELAGVEAELKAREVAVSGKVGDVEATWRDRAAVLEKEFTAFRENAAETLRKSEASWMEKVAELERKAAGVEKEFSAFRESADNALRKSEASWMEKVADLEKRVAGAVSAAEGTGTGDPARQDKVAEMERDAARLRGELAEAKGELTRRHEESTVAEQVWRQKIAALEENVAALEGEADGLRSRLAEREREYADRLEAARNETAAKLGELEKIFQDFKKASHDRETAMRAAGEKEKKALEERIAGLNAEVQQLSELYGSFGPARSIGRIVERLAGDQILLISGGVQERVRPGMKFDVHRPIGAHNRRVGSVKVIRVMDGYSMAVPTYADAEILVCPETGRAVLEPGARFSPFAVGKDGKPLALRKAGETALPLDAPAIGDFIDNPFYDPMRPMTFVLSPALSGNACAVKIIETLGGVVRGAGESADFLVVADETERPAVAKGIRPVTIEHLAGYLDPKPLVGSAAQRACAAPGQ